MKHIGQFITNPLGIMALFVVLVEGIAGLVISINFSNLYGNCERLPLIWFIVLFPLVVLAVFVWLVICHNTNLYGPHDFDNQELYLQANGKVIKPHKAPKVLKKPEKIRVKKLQKSICLLAYANPDISDNPSLKIQDAALKRYSDENEMEIKTEVQISKRLVCDGVSVKNGNLYLFEVVANYRSADTGKIMRTVAHMSNMVSEIGDQSVQCILILVSTEQLTSEAIKAISNQVNNVLSNVEIVNYVADEIMYG